VRTNKGFTLIEVVVALGILAIVIAGTVTLIVEVVGLELTARVRTEAVALAQKNLAEAIASMENGCTNDALISGDWEEWDEGQYRVTQIEEFNYGEGLDNSNFIKVVSTVTWQDRKSADYSYEVSQIVRKK
jgi:prepilin-type N-terminal cleavage/methylation domain-containing protein